MSTPDRYFGDVEWKTNINADGKAVDQPPPRRQHVNADGKPVGKPANQPPRRGVNADSPVGGSNE